MSLAGNLQIFPLDEVLLMLTRSAKTGCLRVEAPSTQGRIYLQSGEVTLATVGTDEDFKRQLVLAALVDDDGLRRVEAAESRLIDEALAGSPDGELPAFLREHSVESLHRIHRHRAGEFDFVVDLEPRYGTGLTIDPAELLSTAERRADEWAEIESVVPDLNARYRMIRRLPDDEPVNVNPSTWYILSALEGGTSVHGLAAALGVSGFKAAFELAHLVRHSLVEEVVAKRTLRSQLVSSSDEYEETPETAPSADADADQIESGWSQVLSDSSPEKTFGDTRSGDPGSGDPGSSDIGSGDPGSSDIGSGDPGSGDLDRSDDPVPSIGDSLFGHDETAGVESPAEVESNVGSAGAAASHLTAVPDEPLAGDVPRPAYDQATEGGGAVPAAEVDSESFELPELPSIGSLPPIAEPPSAPASRLPKDDDSWWNSWSADLDDAPGTTEVTPETTLPATDEQRIDMAAATESQSGPGDVGVGDSGDQPAGGGRWWAQTMDEAIGEPEADSKEFLEGVFDAVGGEDEGEDQEETGFGRGLLRRRLMGSVPRDTDQDS